MAKVIPISGGGSGGGSSLATVVIADESGDLTDAQVSGTLITNYGQAVANVQDLPASKAGMHFRATAETTGKGAWSFDPNGSEVIVLNGTALTAGNKVTLATPASGDTIMFACLRDGTWYANTVQGTFTDGGS